MTKEERELTQNVIRVGINLGVLLDIGLFPGKHSLGVEECKGFVKSLVEDANARLVALAPPPQTTETRTYTPMGATAQPEPPPAA